MIVYILPHRLCWRIVMVVVALICYPVYRGSDTRVVYVQLIPVYELVLGRGICFQYRLIAEYCWTPSPCPVWCHAALAIIEVVISVKPSYLFMGFPKNYHRSLPICETEVHHQSSKYELCQLSRQSIQREFQNVKSKLKLVVGIKSRNRD